MSNLVFKGLFLFVMPAFLQVTSAETEITFKDAAAVVIVGQGKAVQKCGVAGSGSATQNCPDSAFPNNDQFLLAVAGNNKARARQLLSRGVNINYRSQNRVVIDRVNVRADKTNPFQGGKKRYQYASGTAYDIALAQANSDMVIWLLKQGANPAAGFFKNKIERSYFAGNYPDSYLTLPFKERAKIVSVGEVLELAVKDNDIARVSRLIKIEPRSIHYQGNRLLPQILQLGKWQIANAFLDNGRDVKDLVNFQVLFNPIMRSNPTPYGIFEKLLAHAKQRSSFDYQDLLRRSIDKKDKEAIRLLVRYGADLNPEKSRPAIFHAANSKNYQMVGFLLKQGAKSGLKWQGRTLLHKAVAEEKPELVKVLLKNRANVNALDISEKTPLQIAIHKKDTFLAKLLIRSGANVNVLEGHKDSLLHIAVRENKPDLVGILIRKGVKINQKNGNDETAFNFAVRDDKPDMVRALLKAGADVNLKDYRGRSPLQVAMLRKDLSMAKLLIASGADVNVEDHFGNTPLLVAVQQVNMPLLKLMLASAAKVNHLNNNKDTALHMAAEKADMEIIRLLINARADVNARNYFKQTSLHIAARKKHIGMVSLLLRHKANPNMADNNGRTPLHLAVMEQNLPITQALLAKSATPNTVDETGDTPLFDALYKRKVQIARTLVNAGAQVNVANDYSRTPLDIAMSKGLRGMANVMRQKGAKTASELGAAGALRVKMIK